MAVVMKKIELTGQTFGGWTVITRSPDKPSYWQCRCTCGTVQDVFSGNLTRSVSTGCKKCRWKRHEHPREYDLTGERFGAWLALHPGAKDHWLCRCDCGETKEVNTSSLTKGTSKGCRGCMRQRDPHQGLGGLKHGLYKSGEYTSWRSMRARCEDPKHDSFADYGGRGITVCERWKTSFEAFLEDMGRKPTRQHTLDRIDADGPYAPHNCRWATPTEQNRNKRYNFHVTVRGITMTLTEAIAYLGGTVIYQTVLGRIRRGWDVEIAITTPARAIRRRTA